MVKADLENQQVKDKIEITDIIGFIIICLSRNVKISGFGVSHSHCPIQWLIKKAEKHKKDGHVQKMAD